MPAPARTRMSSADAAWLHMDRPTNLMAITSVLLFERPLERERLAEHLMRRMIDRYPRFRQRVVESRVPLRPPSFEDDPHFDIERHLHRRGLHQPRDLEALRDLVEDLASQPLDHSKPLWDWYLVEGPGSGGAAIVRMHHCIADGISLARVMLSLTDTAPQGGELFEAPRRRAPSRFGPLGALTGPAGAALSAARTTVETVAGEAREVVRRPRHGLELAERLGADARALGKLVFIPPDPKTAFRGPLRPARRVAWNDPPLSLRDVKEIAHAQQATVNDVLLTAVTGALRRYLIDHAEPPRELHAIVPFNLRPLDRPLPAELGNRFGLVYLHLPLSLSDRRRRLEELKRRMDEIKRSPEGPVSYAVLEAVGFTPPELESRIVDLFSAKGTAVMTNVPGPPQTVYLTGNPLRSALIWAPTSGSVAMSVSILSYQGEVTIGLMVDAHLVPDPASIIAYVRQEIDALSELHPAAARPGATAPGAHADGAPQSSSGGA